MLCPPAFFPIPHSPMHGALRPHFSSRKSRKTTRPRLNTFLLQPHSPIASRFLHACRATFTTTFFTIGAVTCFKKPSPLAVCNFPGALESHRWLELSPTFAARRRYATPPPFGNALCARASVAPVKSRAKKHPSKNEGRDSLRGEQRGHILQDGEI